MWLFGFYVRSRQRIINWNVGLFHCVYFLNIFNCVY
uniref:Uncharacterized protein n=1 Tax=Arundo donax TaxID=35708 RepID=A0A0A9AK58_ARUDO